MEYWSCNCRYKINFSVKPHLIFPLFSEFSQEVATFLKNMFAIHLKAWRIAIKGEIPLYHKVSREDHRGHQTQSAKSFRVNFEPGGYRVPISLCVASSVWRRHDYRQSMLRGHVGVKALDASPASDSCHG